MEINEAIQKAIEGGYKIGGHPLRWNEKTKSWWYYWMSEDENGDEIELENPACLDHPDGLYPALLDSSFWEALENSLGWDCDCKLGSRETKDLNQYGNPVWEFCKKCCPDGIHYEPKNYIYHWHRFIDYLAEGKSVDEFFKDLT